MAGNAVAVKNFLRDRFGFAQSLQDAFVDEQGFSEWNDGRDLTMEDIETMCKNMRRPGGTIPNPRAATAGQPATIPNPGINVGYVQERQLKQMVVQIQYLAKVQRTFTPAQATLALLTQSWRAFIEDKHIATEMTPSPPKCTKSFETKVINCNMWRGPYDNKAKCQPEYDANKKGEEVQERGYEPQYYEAPEEWSAKPPAKRLSEQWPEYWHPKTRRYITIKKVEFKEHHDNDVDKPKENPKPSNL